MEPYQIILDSNILYSALRSNRGALFKLLSMINSSKFEINLSVPLVIEYEYLLKNKVDSLVFDESQIDSLLDYLCLIGNWHEVYFLWRPILNDPEDDMILELAVKAGCEFIVTYNKRDFRNAIRFNVQAVDAKEFLQIINEMP